MGKKKKTEETWNCGDCNAELPISTEWCDAPQHEWAEQVIRLKYVVSTLRAERTDEERERVYMTPDEFVSLFSPMLKEYLVKTYGDEKSHPHDLATAAASFMEAYWIISDYRGI